MKKSVVEQNPAEECYLCGSRGYLERHHQDSREGVHHNREKMRKLQKIGQQAFEQTYPGKDFRQIFGRNYLEGGSRSLKGKE